MTGPFAPPDLPVGVADFEDLRRRARRRLPHFVFEYLDGGIGRDVNLARNASALDQVRLTPRIADGPAAPDISVEVMGRRWAAPFGVAPIGLSGLFHPKAAIRLAEQAARLDLPFSLSIVAGDSAEAVSAAANRPPWQQLYWPADADIQTDILARMRALYVDTLVLTVDIPTWSWRERSVRAGSTGAPSAAMKARAVVSRPAWAWRMARAGGAGMPNLAPYVAGGVGAVEKFMLNETLRPIGPTEIASLRDRWDGKLVVKGVMAPEDAEVMAGLGVDGIVVSNHGGRQLDAAPATVEMLPEIAAAVGGRLAVIADGGVRSGLDVLRLLALGADFVLTGRAPYFAMAALGDRGVGWLDLMALQAATGLTQLGVRDIEGLRGLKASVGP